MKISIYSKTNEKLTVKWMQYTVLNSLKLFHDLFDVGKTKRIRITKMKRALTNTCSNKKELQSKDEV